MFQVHILKNIKTKRKMKNRLLLCIAFLMMLCSCEEKKVYRPSQFPHGQNKSNYSFAIPYQNNNGSIVVRIRLNGGPQFNGIWDSGCSIPLKISLAEALQLEKEGTLSESDYQVPITVANGETMNYDVYMIKSIEFTDNLGNEHSLSNITAVVDENIGTSILIGLPIMEKLGYSYEISQYDQLIYFK